MFLRVVTIIFLFLIRIRFPEGKSIAEVIRVRYGNEVLKATRKFERTDYKYRKAKLDLEFLETCEHHEFTPHFLRFKLSNRNLQSTSAYRSCQKRLLKEEISQKKSKIRHFEREHKHLKATLKDTLSYIDFAHICCLFLTQNDKDLARDNATQRKKLFNLGLDDNL